MGCGKNERTNLVRIPFFFQCYSESSPTLV
jgi:hypothetical protein